MLSTATIAIAIIKEIGGDDRIRTCEIFRLRGDCITALLHPHKRIQGIIE